MIRLYNKCRALVISSAQISANFHGCFLFFFFDDCGVSAYLANNFDIK